MPAKDFFLVAIPEIERYLVAKGAITVNIEEAPAEAEHYIEQFLMKRRDVRPGVESWSHGRQMLAVQQLMFKDAGADPGNIDGLLGPKTLHAHEQWQDLVRDVDVPKKVAKLQKTVWPRENGVPKFYGPPGQNLVRLELPYPMKIAWDLDETVTGFMIHKKCAESAGRVLAAVKAHYGMKEIQRLGLDLFGGCIANPPRFKRGSKSSPSMHNWGIAIDFDPVRNQLRWGRDRARLALPSCDRFWELWEEEGWVSLGRQRNYDWMHIQAAAL